MAYLEFGEMGGDKYVDTQEHFERGGLCCTQGILSQKVKRWERRNTQAAG